MATYRFTERPWFYSLLIFAAVLKFALFFYIITMIPEAFLDPDSPRYLKAADSIHTFFLYPAGGLTHSMKPLPGYPLILAFWQYVLGLSLHQVIFVQILFNFFTAVIVARIAHSLNPKWEVWGLFIVLLDVPLTIYSQMIMTESFFVFALACFILCFHRYLRTPSYRRLMGAILVLVICGFIRPVAYYLPLVVAAFVVFSRCAGHWKKTLAHACLILLIFYGLSLPWKYRNYKRFGDARMSSIGDVTINRYAFFKDSKAKKPEVAPQMSDYLYYPMAFLRNVTELLTTPGSTKHCRSLPMLYFTKGFGYSLIVFWVPGFLVGLACRRKDARYSFLIWVFLYFLFATIGATGWTVTSRFRIAMLPSIAVIAAAGWVKILSWWQCKIMDKNGSKNLNK